MKQQDDLLLAPVAMGLWLAVTATAIAQPAPQAAPAQGAAPAADAGPAPKAGPAADAGPAPKAGPAVDTGPAPKAGPAADAGPAPQPQAEASQPAGTPATEATEPAEASAASEPTAAGATTGQLHLVVFAQDTPAQAARVVTPGGRDVTTDAAGAIELELPPGEHTLQLHFPEGTAPKAIAGVLVAVGQRTDVIATVAADGMLTLDIQVPHGATAESVDAEQQQLPRGTLTGVVLSDDSGEPVAGARVYVAGQPVEATTDAAGRFILEGIVAGTHAISVLHTKFSTQTIPDIVVVADESRHVEARLTPAAIELEDFVISAPHISGGVATVMTERRQSAAVSDAIGAEDIARMPASNAAQAAQRVVGATIVGGRFVYVRGLGERYSNALLNGAPLPSPEPDRATVPLDLFPSGILKSLDISKTFTPDVPANFAGGSVRIVTKSVPEDPLLSVSFSSGYNSLSTFRRYYGSVDPGKYDFLAIDDGSRALTDKAPTEYRLNPTARKPDGDRVGRTAVEELSDEFNTPMHVKRRTMYPNFNGSIAAGDRWELGGGKKLGVLASIMYRRDFRLRRETINEFRADSSADTGVSAWNLYEAESATDAVRWGAFTSTTFELNDDHSISLVAMHSQLGDTNTRLFEGFSSQLQQDITTIRNDFTTRGLTNGQLQGDHTLDMLNKAQLQWLLSMAQAARNEDDTRDAAWQYPPNAEVWTYHDSPSSGRHYYSDQSEFARVGGFDWTQPIVELPQFELKAKAGVLVSLKDREFTSRTFALRPKTTAPNDFGICGEDFDPIACPTELFTDENVGENLVVGEATGQFDAYEAQLNVKAAYLMADVGLLEDWRVIGGARIEQTYQEIISIDQFTGEPVESELGSALLEQTDILPAVAVVYSPIEQAAIRVAGSQTLARPQLRELAPFAYFNYFGGALEQGNPDLKLTKILNGDIRFEFFPTPSEVAALSFFVKDFKDPIEPIFKPQSENSLLTYENAKGASLYGAEIELRKNLGFITNAIEDFGVIASLMLATSSIQVEQTGTDFLTNLDRPLVQAAPYVINAAVDYENKHGTLARILYNVSGKRLVAVGTEDLDDSYLQPQHMVDLSASQQLWEQLKIRLTVRNLLNETFVVTEGKNLDKRYASTPQGTVSNVRNKYRIGTSINLGLGYTY